MDEQFQKNAERCMHLFTEVIPTKSIPHGREFYYLNNNVGNHFRLGNGWEKDYYSIKVRITRVESLTFVDIQVKHFYGECFRYVIPSRKVDSYPKRARCYSYIMNIGKSITIQYDDIWLTHGDSELTRLAVRQFYEYEMIEEFLDDMFHRKYFVFVNNRHSRVLHVMELSISKDIIYILRVHSNEFERKKGHAGECFKLVRSLATFNKMQLKAYVSDKSKKGWLREQGFVDDFYPEFMFTL
jgi:hypothetical protein